MQTPVLVGVSAAICVLFSAWLLLYIIRWARSATQSISVFLNQLKWSVDGMKALRVAISELGETVSTANASHARVSQDIANNIAVALASLSDNANRLAAGNANYADRLAEGLSKVEASIAELSKYNDGFVKVCEAHVAQYEKIRSVIESFKEAIAPSGPGSQSEVQHYDENLADSTFMKQAFMARGFTSEEAISKAKEEDAMRVFTPINPSTPGY